jgi:hypothetical protein
MASRSSRPHEKVNIETSDETPAIDDIAHIRYRPRQPVVADATYGDATPLPSGADQPRPDLRTGGLRRGRKGCGSTARRPWPERGGKLCPHRGGWRSSAGRRHAVGDTAVGATWSSFAPSRAVRPYWRLSAEARCPAATGSRKPARGTSCDACGRAYNGEYKGDANASSSTMADPSDQTPLRTRPRLGVMRPRRARSAAT